MEATRRKLKHVSIDISFPPVLQPCVNFLITSQFAAQCRCEGHKGRTTPSDNQKGAAKIGVIRGIRHLSLAEESFTDLDFADDVSLLAEMLEILVAGLLVLQDEAAPLGLQINWSKTNIQHVGEPRLTQPSVLVAAENVDLVDEFIYLGLLISHDGESEAEIL